MPHQPVHTAPRTVRCPECRRLYLALVSLRWWHALLLRTFNWPPLTCRPCARAQALATLHGGSALEWRSPEQDAC